MLNVVVSTGIWMASRNAMAPARVAGADALCLNAPRAAPGDVTVPRMPCRGANVLEARGITPFQDGPGSGCIVGMREFRRRRATSEYPLFGRQSFGRR